MPLAQELKTVHHAAQDSSCKLLALTLLKPVESDTMETVQLNNVLTVIQLALHALEDHQINA